MGDSVQKIIGNLSIIERDSAVPKNVRLRVKNAMDILSNSEKNISLRVHQSLETLGDICDDPNLQPYVKMQIWGIVSQLESN